MQGISIIMHAHNAAAYLERSLPLTLTQDYPCFEVLVVVDTCTDLTVERLEQMEVRWPSLRHISIPSSAWHHDRHQLALALGAKAARYDWVVILQPEYAPQSTAWLRLMAAAINTDTERVIGYNGIETSEGEQERFVTTFEQWLTLPYHRTAAEDSNIMARRELLLQPALCDPHRSAVVMHRDATVRRTLPYGTIWWHEQLRRMRRHNTAGLLHALAVWQTWIVCAAAAVIGWQQQWWIGVAIFLLWLIISTTLFAVFCRKNGERPFYLSYIYHTLTLPLLLWK